LSLIDADDASHAGVIYVRQEGRGIGDVVKAVDSHLEQRGADDAGIAYL
jgi:GTP cyclohydrolase II